MDHESHVYVQGRRTWVRLHEKGGRVHEMPCHDNLEEYVDAYLSTAGMGDDKKAFPFRSAKGQGGQLSALPMSEADVYRMIGRRAAAASVDIQVGCHSFRATGITQYWGARPASRMPNALSSRARCNQLLSREASLKKPGAKLGESVCAPMRRH